MEFSLSETPHSSHFMWSGLIPMIQADGQAVGYSIKNDTTRDRVLFFLAIGNDVGAATAYINIHEQPTATPTGLIFRRRDFWGTLTTEAETLVTGGTGLSSSVAGNFWNGFITGTAILWPAGWYLHVSIAGIAGARTHQFQYGYWERPLNGTEVIG